MKKLFLLVTVWAFAAQGATMDEVLNRMDTASVSFRGVKGNIRQLSHTDIVNEDDIETGTILLKRPRPHDIRMLIDLTKPDAKTVALDDKTLSIYLPKIATVQTYDLGKSKGLLEQFLLLGFGASRADLAAAYDIAWLGEDLIKGEKTGHLQLTPKTRDVLQRVRKIELWLNEATGYPAQHKLFLPGNDYWLVTFSDLKVNPDLPDSALKLKLPKGVKTQSPR
jgi:outer membrane lipoprotein-sorting protein